VTHRDVTRALSTAQPLDILEAKPLGVLPATAGFYAWWRTPPGAIPGLPDPAQPIADLQLLYVGIAPRDAGSQTTLASRLRHQHIGGNIGSSTFRFGLAALLWEHEGWQPHVSAAGKYRLTREHNAALSAWQRAHLRLSWAEVPEPWRFEADVIVDLRPPMNREHNQSHPFYNSVGNARDRLRAAAVPIR
jgi:hypothetical protein